ncbi:hypothetical protein ACQP1W_46245 [Spirillospora sp. CA-255316]
MTDLDWEAEFAARLDELAAEHKREFVREFCAGAAFEGLAPRGAAGRRGVRTLRAHWGVMAGVAAAGLALGAFGVAYHVLGPADRKSGSMHLAEPGRSEAPAGTRAIRISWPDSGFVTDGRDGPREPGGGGAPTGIRIGGVTYTSGWLLTGDALEAERTIGLETSVAQGDLTAVVAALGTSEPCRWTATAGGVRKSVRAPAGGHEALSFPIERSTGGVTVRVERDSPQGSCVMAGVKVHGRPAGPDERAKPAADPPDGSPGKQVVERGPTGAPPGTSQPASPPVESPPAEPVQPEPQSPTPTPAPAN